MRAPIFIIAIFLLVAFAAMSLNFASYHIQASATIAQLEDKVRLKDPTYQEVKTFIEKDQADHNVWQYGVYNCCDFTADVIDRAQQVGLRCGAVWVQLENTVAEDYLHALVAFNTTDRGAIFIEPQSDEEVTLEVGELYSFLPAAGEITKVTILWSTYN